MNLIEQINQKYDINETHVATIDLPFEYIKEFRITAIIGGSGTGKSTLLRKWFNSSNTNFNFEGTLSIFEHLYENIGDFDETSQLLFDVGLASVPVWKNNYAQLSNGEKLRFEIAYKLSTKGENNVIFVDEFTSMLDRQVAKNLAFKINDLVRKYDKNLVIATAHYDVLEWMKVDRMIDTTLKKAFSLQTSQHLTHMDWKSVVYQEICGEYLSNITI